MMAKVLIVNVRIIRVNSIQDSKRKTNFLHLSAEKCIYSILNRWVHCFEFYFRKVNEFNIYFELEIVCKMILHFLGHNSRTPAKNTNIFKTAKKILFFLSFFFCWTVSLSFFNRFNLVMSSSSLLSLINCVFV